MLTPLIPLYHLKRRPSTPAVGGDGTDQESEGVVWRTFSRLAHPAAYIDRMSVAELCADSFAGQKERYFRVADDFDVGRAGVRLP